MLSSQKIGLIAGQGSIPEGLVARWETQGLTPVIVGLKGITDPSLYKNRIAAEFPIGHAGHILNFFKSNGVTEMVMVGALKRPNFWTIIPDIGGITILAKLLIRKRGDDSLLRFIRKEIERHGIHVVGVHEYMPELLCPAGVLGKISPTVEDMDLIKRGFHIAKQHGADDEGQSVVMNSAGSYAVETVEGTNALIDSYAGQIGAILVKVSKPQQDMALDMPTIGLTTIKHALQAGFKGIVVEAGKTIILDRATLINICDDENLFLVGLEGQHDI